MVIFPVLSFFLMCHHQTAYLTLWPQKGCFSSRHYTKAVPPRVRKEVVNVSCLSSPGTPLSHSAPSADLGFRAHWPGLWGAEINVMLLDRDPLGVEESKIKTPKHQKRKKKKKKSPGLGDHGVLGSDPSPGSLSTVWPGGFPGCSFCSLKSTALPVFICFITFSCPRRQNPANWQGSFGTFDFSLQQAARRCQRKPIIKENYVPGSLSMC